MRNRRIFLLFLLTLIGQFSFTQQNFEPGLVIHHTGVTVKGFIDYRNWGKNPDKINFKESDSSQVIILTHGDIREFQVHGEIYISAVVNSETSPVSTNELEYDPDLNILVDSTFLQVLVEGSKSLYYYNGESGNKNFYILNDSLFELLIYKRYINKEEGIISENKKYLGQLALYLEDCQAIQSLLGTVDYSMLNLMKLFKDYYNCIQSEASYQKQEEKLKIEVGPIAGVTLTKLNFYSGSINVLENTDYNLSLNFTGGLFFDIIPPRNQRRWSVNNELSFAQYNCTGQYEEYENENNYKIITTEIGYGYIKISSMARYQYPLGKMHIYFNGGISVGFGVMHTNYKKSVIKFFVVDKVDYSYAVDVLRNNEESVLVGIGVKYNRLSLETRYERGNGMSGQMSLKSVTQRFYILAGCRF